ncbi:MAG TPA: ABC transporter ATP-binding protein [Anaerolineales bacterium]|nr:ABC transporter ATP-binding protein [Anaerolineales bacterium]
MLRFENVSKSYQEGSQLRVVLHNAHAEIQAGEAVAILGKSGTGKSTLLNIISGIDVADVGNVWVDGQNLTALNEHERTLFRRHEIGFVFQFFNLIPTLTTWENILLPLELVGKVGASERERAQALLNDVGLWERRDTFPDRLSGGEQQRVALARALVHQPKLVLADEPTGNLDEDTGQKILALLDRLTRQQGRTLLMVTHSSDAATFADRILRLQDGQLLPSELG